MDSGKMETNFKKPREVFVQNGLKNKNLSHNLHRCPGAGIIEAIFKPYFSGLCFLLFQS
jgi:hypothetical protein